MAIGRRKGSEHSATRLKLIEAAESLMLEEGYAAVTARRLAVKGGLKSQLLHYYFEDMDELFAAVIRRRGEVNLEKMVRELADGTSPGSLVELPERSGEYPDFE